MKRSFDLQRIAPAALLVLAALARPALAQPSAQKAAAAQALFEDAMVLIDHGDPAAACPKLEEAQRLDPGMATQFRLAECYEKAGRPASAWALFLAVAESARLAHSPERETFARQRAAALAPTLARMTVSVTAPVAALPGLQIQRDGIVVEKELWGVAVPVDPGAHVVVVTATGKQRWEGKGTAGPNSLRLAVTVPMLEDTLKSGPIEPSPSAAPPPSEPRSERRSLVPALVIGGVGVAGIGVGAALLAASAGALTDAKTKSAELRGNGQSCSPAFANFAGADACNALASTTAKVDTLHNVALVPLIVGGAAIGGALLCVLWPASAPKSDAAGVRAAPMLGRGEGGLLLSGSF